jgi:hypothetical protein
MSAGIFGLSGYNDKNLSGLIPDKTREAFREYGYFGGGQPGLTSRVDRIDYSNDTQTASVRGPLSLAKSNLAASGNSNFGYFGGGSPGPVSTVDRIDYSNDSATVSVRGPLSLSRRQLAATGNSNFGYFGGGRDVSSPYQTFSTIDRINYSNDLSQASVRSTLSITRGYCTGNGNSNFGYFAGGRTSIGPIYYSIIDRINYSNDTSTTSSRGNLTASKDSLGFTGNLSYGWLFGGTQPYYSRIERIDYSNDLVLPSIRTTLSAAKSYGSAFGNSNFGFYGGGYVFPAVPGNVSLVERIDYSNDTQTPSIRGPLSSARFNLAATSSASFGGAPISQYGVFPKPFGYFGGGFVPGSLSTVDRIDYSNDTQTASIRGPLSSSKYYLSATGNSNFGYFGGGNLGPVSTVDRIDYFNDLSTASVRGPLSLARYALSAVGNSNFGYFGGGFLFPTPPYSTVDRVNYSNDTATASVRGPLSSATRSMGVTGNSNFGYFGGGSSPAIPATYSIVNRINYSNDTATVSVRGPLSSAKTDPAATGNSNFGYFGGGIPGPLSTVDRIDYSNDTATASIRGPLSSSRYQLAATGNSNFGYFGGGSVIPGKRSTVDRIDYANDLVTASVRGPLSSIRSNHAATSPLTPSSAFSPAQLPLGTSNTDFQPTSTFFDIQSMRRIEDTTNASVRKRVLGSFGYFGGGYFNTSTLYSSIQRIDYSNDTTKASIRGSLSINRRQHSATGNSNFGYHIAGNIASPSVMTTTIDRLDYSNDNATCIVRGNTTSGTSGRSFGATGNSNFGYVGNWSYASTTNRIDYSNDNLTASIRGPLSSSKGYATATGNQNFGYFGGGAFFPGSIIYSTIDRINYSNDLSRSLVRGPLSLQRGVISATGNYNFGYFGGGGQVTIITSVSTVDRIDYSNDTATASVRGPLSSVRQYLAATGNSNFGYFGGGAPGPLSTIDRIDYSNDTQTASVRGPLSLTNVALAATTNARNS